jgi:hypothetical protein
MKKLIVSILCCVMLFSITSYAEVDFNIDDYTDDELKEISQMITAKLNAPLIVPTGYYVVGQDLPAGRYTIVENDEMPDEEYAHVAFFNSTDDYNNTDDWFDDNSPVINACNTLWNGMTGDLTDGMVIAVKVGNAGIRKVSSGLFDTFWNESE